jgi:hypothetical protein
VLVHLVVSFVYGIARRDADVPLRLAASLFVVIVVLAGSIPTYKPHWSKA